MESFITEKNVVDSTLSTREEVLEFLSQKAIELGAATSAQDVLDAFHRREDEGETGMVDGFAIPHAKDASITSATVVVVRLANPVEWPSIDGQPTTVAIALYAPDAEAGTTHLKLLAKTAAMIMDEGVRDQIRDSDDAAAIAALINERLGE